MIRFYNKYGEELRFKDFVELQWNRKFHEAGSFVLYMAAKDYDPEIMYISNDGRPEMGLVQKVQMEETKAGKFITLSGFFIEKLLDSAAFTKTQIMDASTANTGAAVEEGIRIALYNAFIQFTDKLKKSINPSSWGVLETDKYAQKCLYETTLENGGKYPPKGVIQFGIGEPIGKTLYDFYKSNGMGYTAKPFFNPSGRTKEGAEPLIGLNIVTRNSRDLTHDVYFGEAYKNVDKMQYVFDISGVKTFFVGVQPIPEGVAYSNMTKIYHDGKWQDAIYETLDAVDNKIEGLGAHKPIKCIVTNISNINNGNEAEVRASMQEELKLTMLNNYKLENVSLDVIQNRYLYLKDYDLGDVCSVMIDTGIYTAKIIEIYEVHKANRVEVQIVLGTPRRKRKVNK